MVARGAPLQFNLRKPSFTAPIRLTRVIRGPGGAVREVPLPSSLAAGFQGLRNFVVVTVRDSAGKTVATRHLPFCPDVFEPQRAGCAPQPELDRFCCFDAKIGSADVERGGRVVSAARK